MYYVEKIIDGIYYYKTTPTGEWKELSKKQLANKLISLKNEIEILKSKLEAKVPSSMRAIQLTHDEIDMIKISLQHVYTEKLNIVSRHRFILGDDECTNIIKDGDKYINTVDVFNGSRDI